MPKPSFQDRKSDLMALHQAALRAADPAAAMRRSLEVDDAGLRVTGESIPLAEGSRLWLVAIGKAALGMTQAALEILGGRITAGVVAHPKGLVRPPAWPEKLRSFAGGHPIPNAGSLEAGAAVADLFEEPGEDDLLLFLVSGGGSAIFEDLRPGLTLEGLQELTQSLQHAGADIHQLNTVRRALSRLKGGGLARLAAPARVVSLALSDVLDDRPEAIASGPTVPSSTGAKEAREVLERFKLANRYPAVVEVLGEASKSKSEKKLREDNRYVVVGSNRQAAEAAVEEAGRLGFQTELITTCLQGEAREAGRVLGGIAKGVRAHGVPLGPPACLVLGGETTVTVRGEGRGGRNQELALGAAISIAGVPRTAVLAFATDGVDGNADAAGAVATGETLARARSMKLSPETAFEKSDCWSFFQALGDLWVTGPSGTNVNDLAIVLVYP